MNLMKIWSVLALLIPILALTGLSLSKRSYQQGQEVVLPIRGFDPRDFLSGHYLTYAIQYGIIVCPQKPDDRTVHESTFVCLEPRQFFASQPIAELCSLFIKGHCEQELFVAGIEKFYIPQEYANSLEQVLRADQGKDGPTYRSEVVLAVFADGQAVVKDLHINGQSWRDSVE